VRCSQEEHSCKIWLQKTTHEKSSSVLRNNLLNPNFLGKRVASDAQQQLVRCPGNRVRLLDSKINNSQVLDGLNSKFQEKCIPIKKILL